MKERESGERDRRTKRAGGGGGGGKRAVADSVKKYKAHFYLNYMHIYDMNE